MALIISLSLLQWWLDSEGAAFSQTCSYPLQRMTQRMFVKQNWGLVELIERAAPWVCACMNTG